MIMDRTNSQTRPSVSSTILVTPKPSGSDPESDASRGRAIQLRTPIGTVASAQIPRIFASEYCSLWSSPGGACTVDALSTPPGATRPSALIFIDPCTEFVLPSIVFTSPFQVCKQPNPRCVPLS